MLATCANVAHMPKMIQIRNVPDDLHRTLKVRAAEAGMSLSGYLLREIRDVAGKPTLHEWLDRMSRKPPVELGESPAETIRRMRDAASGDVPEESPTETTRRVREAAG